MKAGAAWAAVIVAGPLFAQRIAAGQAPSPGGAERGRSDREAIALIRGYRKWTRVNPKPFQMQPAAATQCASPSAAQLPSAHLRKFATVYVSDAGKAAMLGAGSPHFPMGTVIVKEKSPKPDGKTIELMTVMVKRDKGFSSENGDWEYLVVDGSGKRITEQGKLKQCQNCHSERAGKQGDFVFRDYYLPRNRQAAR